MVFRYYATIFVILLFRNVVSFDLDLVFVERFKFKRLLKNTLSSLCLLKRWLCC
jgi:hypothetical protein